MLPALPRLAGPLGQCRLKRRGQVCHRVSQPGQGGERGAVRRFAVQGRTGRPYGALAAGRRGHFLTSRSFCLRYFSTRGTLLRPATLPATPPCVLPCCAVALSPLQLSVRSTLSCASLAASQYCGHTKPSVYKPQNNTRLVSSLRTVSRIARTSSPRAVSGAPYVSESL